MSNNEALSTFLHLPQVAQKNHASCSRLIFAFLPQVTLTHPPTSLLIRAQRVPDTRPKPEIFSIPDPYPICFQNHRVFRVSGISENYIFDLENVVKELQDIN